MKKLEVMRLNRYFVMASVCFCLLLGQAQARDLKVSMPCPLVPLVESKEKGILIDLKIMGPILDHKFDPWQP